MDQGVPDLSLCSDIYTRNYLDSDNELGFEKCSETELINNDEFCHDGQIIAHNSTHMDEIYQSASLPEGGAKDDSVHLLSLFKKTAIFNSATCNYVKGNLDIELDLDSESES